MCKLVNSAYSSSKISTAELTPLLLTSAERDWFNQPPPTEQSISSAQHLVLLQLKEEQQIGTDLGYARQLSQTQTSSISSAQHLVLLQQRDEQWTEINLDYVTSLPETSSTAIDDWEQTKLMNAIELSLQDLKTTAFSPQHHNTNTVPPHHQLVSSQSSPSR